MGLDISLICNPTSILHMALLCIVLALDHVSITILHLIPRPKAGLVPEVSDTSDRPRFQSLAVALLPGLHLFLVAVLQLGYLFLQGQNLFESAGDMLHLGLVWARVQLVAAV